MSDDEFRKMMAALGAEFRQGLPERMDLVDRLWRRLCDGRVDEASMIELIQTLHTLAGSAGTFGLDAVSATAAEAESRLEAYREAGTVADAAGRAEISRLLETLRRAAAA